MRKLIVICGLIALPHSNAWASQSFEEHILANYPFVIEKLEARGLIGPVWKEIAKYALIRQAVEDGVTRTHTKSIVGMSVGGAHAEVMAALGLKKGCENEHGWTLSTTESYYQISGPRANVCSVIAMCLLWDRYVTELHPGKFKDDEKRKWITAKELSQKAAAGLCDATEKETLEELKPLYKGTIRKANVIYSATAGSEINSLVEKMDKIFRVAGY